MKLIAPTLLLCSLAMLTACNSEYQSGDFSRDYRQALQNHPGAPVEADWVARFVAIYQDFDGEHLDERLRELYAPRLFFNDTLHSHRERAHLIDYLTRTHGRLESMSLEILDKRIHGRDVYLRWAMRTRFRAGWREAEAETIGMSHLRFNDNGRVVLHQDFWDSRQGLFEHIPVVSGVLQWIRSGL